MRLARVSGWLVAACAVALCLSTPATADIQLVGVDWVTMPGAAPTVRFHMGFRNPGPGESGPVAGELLAQSAFGVFLGGQETPIGVFNIPPLQPDSFFDVFIDVPLSSLPPSAAEVPPSPVSPSGGVWTVSQGGPACLPDDHWDGNVDVVWSGPGGSGQVFKHMGTLYVYPGGGFSYIHVVTMCAGNASWVVNGLCAGFSATLVNEDFTPAANPLPAAWTGWLRVSAAGTVPVLTVCNFTVDFLCGGQPARLDISATACEIPPTSTESSTWGRIKALYR